MTHDGLFARRPHAFHLVKNRNRHRLVAQLAMEGDGKAMGFIAHLLNEIERGRARGKHHRRIVPRHEHLFVGLSKAANRNVETQRFELIHSSRELRLSAVDHKQVGP